ncbi:MAG TPA: zinc ABC transporter substrate-binding protein [Stellaceae bacterium]|jgi:zinc/manganese transport system substrate-binding protein
MRHLIIVWVVGCAIGISAAVAAPLRIVAAENFYGDIARQIGGGEVAVTSILSNPDQDPHEFEANPSTARAFAAARLVIYNGADYDPWAVKLLAASPSSSRETIVVARLVHRKAGDNPHLWYEPGTMPALAAALAGTLAKLDPAHQADYAQRLASFRKSMIPLDREIAALRKKYFRTAVTATEPVFGYMADALGLAMRNPGFQLAVMNDAEPSASDIAKFEQDLRSRAVKVLLYNSQTSEALTRRMRMIATKAGVPVIGVSETEPRGKDYQEWMLSQLQALDRALAH